MISYVGPDLDYHLPRGGAKLPAAAITHICTLDYVAKMLAEDAELLEAIVYNNENLTYGSIVSVYVGPDETITALTDDGIEVSVRLRRSFRLFRPASSRA